eukprot:CAMPEP_0172591052 /NCGR_PEP_ID=MMETSP1068-20121228/9729_1 /TAXON_ID=35684 /ORGANISM="Pseudopedinella elastica, Strain CCMP716" /LENGTH=1018 /DNA_ID=CAMNT_0013387269 /DNA_START=45 /DNA_END=3101 /DNA_ORIENTATION=-
MRPTIHAVGALLLALGAEAGKKKGPAIPDLPPPPPEGFDLAKMMAMLSELATKLESLPDLTIFLGSCALLAALYFGGLLLLSPWGLPKKGLDRRKSWIITFFSSLIMSSTGLYFAFRLYDTKGSILLPDLSDVNATDAAFSSAICLFFLAYCLTDTLFGIFAYSGEVNVGFQHHTVYAALLVYLLKTGQSLLFAVCAIEELPTLIVSLYELAGDTRPRLATGLAIFALRVTYHCFITYKASELINTPMFFFSSYLLLHHIAWFRSWFIKRVEAVKNETEAVGSHDAARASAKQKRLKLEVESHVYLVSALMIAQACMHAVLVLSELGNFRPSKLWNEPSKFSMAFVVLVLDLLGHALCFLLTTARMAGIIQDVYTEHFIFHTIESRSIIYNISWEDPRVERELLKMGGDDVVLTISSAGCNVLDYLVTKPKAIVACDFNQAQLAMLELKLACISCLDHRGFWAIWAESDYATFTQEWPKLRKHILDSKSATSASTISFWDENAALIKDNIMFAGSSGLAARLLMPGLRFLGIVDYMLSRKQYPPATIGLALLRGILQSQTVWAWMAPLGGVPESQLNLISREPQVWSDRLEEVLGRRMWMSDNYFYYAYVAGKWDLACCPPYMHPDNFAALKDGVNKKVTLVHGGWADGAETRDDFTVASLLDSMDWMPDSMIAENIARLYPHMSDGTKKGSKKGVIFWRSFATKVHSPVLAALRPELVPDLDGRERVGWYLSQWVAPVYPHAEVDFSRFLNKGSDTVFANTAVQDAKVLGAMALHALRTEKSAVEFYRSQGDAYDGFRETLLPGRDVLQQYCLPWHRKPKTWISVGCGTARDIEYVIGHLKACGTHLFLLDLSPDLLEMARERVAKHGLEDRVTLVVADILAAFDAKGQPNPAACTFVGSSKQPLPALGQADLVTCSYCLTMIPPWKEALEVMVQMVKPGGSLALIDFTRREDKPKHWSQALNTWWFAHDGVYFDQEHTATLKNHPKLKTIWYHETEARVPFTPLQATHYLYTGLKL